MFKHFTLTLATLLCLLLNACTSGVDDTASVTDLETRKHQMMKITDLEERGRIGISARYKKASFAVNSIYHYRKNMFSLEFTGPMGVSYAKLDVYANGSTFLDVRGTSYSGDNARELLAKEFGIDVPVEKLPFIMFGIPEGDITLDEKGLVKTAQYKEEYLVTYKEHKLFHSEYLLPTFIEIKTPFTEVIVRISEISRFETATDTSL